MTKLFFVLIIILLFSFNVLSQSINGKSNVDSVKNIYSYGLQYYIVDGIFIAFKFNSNFPGVWRLKLDFSGSIADQSSTSERFNSANEIIDTSEQLSDNRQFEIGLSFEYNYFFSVHKRLKPYVGLGPLLSYSYSDAQSEFKTDEQPLTYHMTDYITKSYGIGLIGVGGIESELVDFISLFLEYSLTYMYYLHRTEHHQYQPEDYLLAKYKTTSHQNVFSLSSIKIGFMVFF